MTPSDLRAARLRLNLAQADMGTAVGYRGSRADRGQKISDMECGRRRIQPRVARLVEMFLAHGVPAGYLEP